MCSFQKKSARGFEEQAISSSNLENSVALSSEPFGDMIGKASQSFDLTRWQDIPNFLSDKYAVAPQKKLNRIVYK